MKRETVPAKRKHHLTRVAARTSQIGRLVSQLLSHAMVSHRAQSITASRIDLAELLNQAVADAIPAAVEHATRLMDSERQAFTPMLAILSAQHETQYSRLFRS